MDESSGVAFLESGCNSLKKRPWKPRDPELVHMHAVFNGQKPAALVPADLSGDRYDERDLQAFARKKGCKVLFYAEPHAMCSDESGTMEHWVGTEKTALIYREDKSRDELVSLLRADFIGEVPHYHERLGRALGYPEADIAEFVAYINRPSKHHPDPDGHLPLRDYITRHAHPAVYDQFAKDPMWEGLLPPRKTRGPGL